MTAFQKNVVFVTGAMVFVLLVAFGLYFAIQSHNLHVAEDARAMSEQKTAWREYNIRTLKALSTVGVFNTDEQKRLDAAGNDVEHMRQALIDIHQGRITLWNEQLEDAQSRLNKLQSEAAYQMPYYAGQLHGVAEQIRKQGSEAKEQLDGYTDALHQIEAWQPVSFDIFQAKKKSGQISSDNFDEQVKIQTIWQNSLDDAKQDELIKNAPKGQKISYQVVMIMKKSTVDALNDDAKSRGFTASWFLCGAGGALCSNIPHKQMQSYMSTLFSPQFVVPGVAGDPIEVGLWRQGYYAVVLHDIDDSGKDEWIARSPSPGGWVSLEVGLASNVNRLKDDGNAEVNSSK